MVSGQCSGDGYRWCTLRYSLGYLRSVFVLSVLLRNLSVVALYSSIRKEQDSLDFLLRPFQIPLHLLGGLLSICEIGARPLEPPLGERLQIGQLALFGV